MAHHVDSFGSVAGEFSEGDPGVPTPPTRLGAKWHNMVDQEIAGSVEAAGLTLDDGDNGQLLEAIRILAKEKIEGEANTYDEEQTFSQGTKVPNTEAYAYASALTRRALCHSFEMVIDANVTRYFGPGYGGEGVLASTGSAGKIRGRFRVPKGAQLVSLDLLCSNYQNSPEDFTGIYVFKMDLPVPSAGASVYGGLTKTVLQDNSGGESVTVPAGNGNWNWAYRAVTLLGGPNTPGQTLPTVGDGYVVFEISTPAFADSATLQLARLTYTIGQLETGTS